MTQPLVGILMGSASDWPIMKHTADQLESFGIPYEAKVLSAHRTPDETLLYSATARTRGLRCIIAAAGGAAHLAGVVAAKTTLPVLAVPIPIPYLQGLDSLLAMVQMPKGIPVATFAIGEAGAANAAIFAAQLIGVTDEDMARKLATARADNAKKVLGSRLPPT
jgi:5-(carboxyamino)imidazole ribonucleotide mutase